MTGMYIPDKKAVQHIEPTRETYEALQYAYAQLNWELFDGTLPNCLITLQRRKRTFGYFHSERFSDDSGSKSDEIALNPAYFEKGNIQSALATLAHEMVHLWQYHFGKPGRGRYHNVEWATKMESLGLMPSHNGEAGGRKTGDTMRHYAIVGGVFSKFAGALVTNGFSLNWRDSRKDKSLTQGVIIPKTQSKSGKRVKYLCEKCGLIAYAKHDAILLCGSDNERLKAQ